MESQKTLDNQTMLSKKNNAERITIADLKEHYRAIAIKTIWYWHENRHGDQQNKTEQPIMRTFLSINLSN